MSRSSIASLKKSKAFKDLVRKRTAMTWSLAALMVIAYFGFITVLAFAPDIFAHTPIEGSHTSLGILVGLGVIFLSFVVTGLYVQYANTVLEPLTEKVHKAANKKTPAKKKAVKKKTAKKASKTKTAAKPKSKTRKTKK